MFSASARSLETSRQMTQLKVSANKNFRRFRIHLACSSFSASHSLITTNWSFSKNFWTEVLSERTRTRSHRKRMAGNDDFLSHIDGISSSSPTYPITYINKNKSLYSEERGKTRTSLATLHRCIQEVSDPANRVFSRNRPAEEKEAAQPKDYATILGSKKKLMKGSDMSLQQAAGQTTSRCEATQRTRQAGALGRDDEFSCWSR